ncbi:unnamed protein product [Prorocentrum cordatum]|uniref:RanBP2-type domain-containing protein n=1 Tax=Prorocentrum cordatum TaxID=2364126 RepID=A0ABN9QKT4_9DINO|nr:unnamed protein product [Polarella glacialis]
MHWGPCSLVGVQVLITGASSGIGAATAWRYAELGCRLALAGRRTERLEALKGELLARFPTLPPPLPVTLDVSDMAAVKALPAKLAEAGMPEVDILINNAGLALGVSAADENDMGDVQTMVQTNILGVMGGLFGGVLGEGRGLRAAYAFIVGQVISTVWRNLPERQGGQGLAEGAVPGGLSVTRRGIELELFGFWWWCLFGVAVLMAAYGIHWLFMQREHPRFVVLVLGDVGHSPRMQYHVRSLAKLGYVDFIGYPGSDPVKDVKENPRVRLRYVRPFRSPLAVPYVVYAACRVLWESAQLAWFLAVASRPRAFLVQNPPAIPSLLWVAVASRLRGAPMAASGGGSRWLSGCSGLCAYPGWTGRALAMELLESFFRQPLRRGNKQRGDAAKQPGQQWQCRRCNGLPNDLTRDCCRGCGAARPAGVRRGGPDGRPTPPARGAAGGVGHQHPSAASAGAPGATTVPPRQWPARPPSPEERAAAAAGKTAALGAAADLLRGAGFDEEADALRKAAARLAKDAAGAKPGARLDSCEAFVSRAERRLAAARADVDAAEAALEAAQTRAAERDVELQEGQRADLALGLEPTDPGCLEPSEIRGPERPPGCWDGFAPDFGEGSEEEEFEKGAKQRYSPGLARAGDDAVPFGGDSGAGAQPGVADARPVPGGLDGSRGAAAAAKLGGRAASGTRLGLEPTALGSLVPAEFRSPALLDGPVGGPAELASPAPSMSRRPR